MPSLARVLPGAYQDSIKLMRISSAASARPGVRQAMAVLGTPMNLEQLRGAGFPVEAATRSAASITSRGRSSGRSPTS